MKPKTSHKTIPTFIFRIIAGYLLCLIPAAVQAQDLIVTNKGDSIHCHITEIKTDHIRYAHVEKDEVAKAFIPEAWVVMYQQNFYNYSEIEILLAQKQLEQQEQRTIAYTQAKERDRQRGGVKMAWLLSAGWSKRIAELKNKRYDDATLAYARAQQSGWNFGLDMRFPISPRNAFGIKYATFYSPHTDDFVIYTPPSGPPSTLNIKSTIWIHYLAPTLNLNIPNADSTRAVMLGFGAGYLLYTEQTGVQPPIKASGDNIGFSLDLGYDFGLRKATSPFVRLSLCIGNLHSAKVEQGSNSASGKLRPPENLSRIDVSVGMKFNEVK